MKRIFLAFVLLIILASLALSLVSCGEKGEFAAPSGMKTASSEVADYYFYVPDDWTVDLSTKATGAYFSKNDPSNVSVTAWELEYSDDTIDDWWAVERADIDLVFKNVEIVSEENVIIDEIYGKKFVYTASLGDNDYKIMQAAVKKNSTVYVFTYTSTPENFDLHIEEVDAMIAHLKIK